MKKFLYMFLVICMCALMVVPFVACESKEKTGEQITVTDLMGREVAVTTGSYKRVVCIGAGALRLYSYICGADNLAAVEDIDNTSIESGRPAMFDGTARPYQMAYEQSFNALPSCGKGGPQAQAAETEKIADRNPDIIISEYEDVDKANTLQSTLDVPVIVVKYGLAGVFDENITKSLNLLGTIFSKTKVAKNLVDFIASEKAEIEKKVKNVDVASQKKVYICGLGNWGTTNELMTAQNYAPFNVAKINNIVTGLAKDGIQGIEQEKFMEYAPDMDIIILDAAAANNIKKAGRNPFVDCKAWKNGDVYLEMAYNAYYTNIEIALINTWYAASVVYPDLFKGFDIEKKANEVTKAFLGQEMYTQIKEKPLSFGGYQKIDTATFFA